ncbi:hypothetical protein BKA65DRAFT_490171 [Rhexocercosporidium sp. MPI-PUGE-AT-0058]|nr:hypothetical protein BKA65DRAFT_490171 [Rhexocercosporidium sp. MPI-PUGE-AT-0058]
MPDLAADLEAAELARRKTLLDIESMLVIITQQKGIIQHYEDDKMPSESSRQLHRKAIRQGFSLGDDLVKLYDKLDQQAYHIEFLDDVTKKGSFPFQRLPPEIRRLILEFLFIRQTWIRLMNPRDTTPRKSGNRGTLAFLLTSRQMFEEASSLFYSKNRFAHVSGLGSTSGLLKIMGGSLRNLGLTVTFEMKLPELQLLEKCQRLQWLQLHIREVPAVRMPKSIARPNTLTEVELSVSDSDDETERVKKERFKEKLGVLLGIEGEPGQTSRRSARLAVAH